MKNGRQLVKLLIIVRVVNCDILFIYIHVDTVEASERCGNYQACELLCIE